MQLISIRTNTAFELNYDTTLLEPSVEVILLVSNPEYKVKGKQVVKDIGLREFRFKTDLNGINKLIGQLQATISGLNTIEQMSQSFNAIITVSKEKIKP